MTDLNFTLVPGDKVTDAQLKTCAALFSQNYGVWSSLASSPFKPGTRVKMNATRLKQQCLVDPSNSKLAICTLDGVLVGHAFATICQYNESNVCWVTQLVVSSQHRERGIATTLLHLLPGPDVKCTAFGLASSHPAACAALSKRAHANLRKLDLDFIKAHAQMIIDTSPVSYLKNAQFHGSLFQDGTDGGAVCSVNTEFFVDHDEPHQTLKRWEERQDMAWPLGKLAEGHEFLCIVPSK